MFRSIGEEKSQLLLAFHAFAGCGQTLPFAHFDQKTAWEAWGAMDDVMAAFQDLSKAPTIMYDRTSTFRKVNDARRDLSTRKGRYILKPFLPPQIP